MSRAIHLVGTVPLPTTDAVFDLLADTVASHMRRIPDGETGVRSWWVSSQARVLHEDPNFEPAGHDWKPGMAMPADAPPTYRLKEGVDPAAIRLASFGYGDFAKESYRLFKAKQAAGQFPASARFQVGLPTPLGFVLAIVAPECQKDVMPAFEARMAQELRDVMAVVPNEELSIQWDAALEIYIWEGIMDTFYESPHQGVLDGLIALGSLVPEPVELGFHLCYGDYDHKHGIEPVDTGNMVIIANALTEGIKRPINWVHMPVPRDRDDEDYFAPLRGLKLKPQTELFLGLIHYTDGEEGTRRRMATADRIVQDYGIATECGLGRRDPATIPELMRIQSCCAG